MAHPYTTRARVQVAAIARDLTDIVDRNRDGAEDVGVLSSCITRACNAIDGALGQRFATPFASTGGVADAGLLADIADELTLVFLLRPIARDKADSMEAAAMAQLAAIRNGETYIDATLRDAGNRRRGVAWEGGGTFIAGNSGTSADDGADGSYATNCPKLRGV